MMEISLCMIVRNAEGALQACLDNVKAVCDEIIIVDIGSSDRTKEIAHTFTETVVDFKWENDFAAARNYSFSLATKDYILWLDDCDMFLDKETEKVMDLKQKLQGHEAGASMIYEMDYDKDGYPAVSCRQNRLVKRGLPFTWRGKVHEYLDTKEESMEETEIAAGCRDSLAGQKEFRDLKREIYEKQLEKGEKFQPRDLFYFAEDLMKNGEYRRSIMYFTEFLAAPKEMPLKSFYACIYMADNYLLLGDHHRHIEALAMAMKYDIPHPACSCAMGDVYLKRKEFKKAAFWYLLAIDRRKVHTGDIPVMVKYDTWYPHLQLCVCYWQEGEKDQAVKHNTLAGSYRPDLPQVLFNHTFFNAK